MECVQSQHSVYRLSYHVVWVCKYRRRVLKPGVVNYIKKLLPKLLRSIPGCEIEQIGFDQDHVHFVMTIPPRYAVAEIIETLLRHGANIEARAKEGITALMLAAVNNENPEIIEALLKHGANIEAKNKDGATALMVAAANNQNPEIIETLLKHGANIEAKTEDGETALMGAAANNPNPKIIKTLIDNGAIIRDGNQLLELLDENENIEKNQDYWYLRDKITRK